MSVEQAILEAVRALPADKKPFKSIKGLWADLGISLSAEEMEQNQREMWKSFPREDIRCPLSPWIRTPSFGI